MTNRKNNAESRSMGMSRKNVVLFVLAFLVCCSVVLAPMCNFTVNAETPGGSSTTPGSNYQTFLNIDYNSIPANVTPTASTFTNLCSGAVSWVASRAIQELTSFLITSDIDGISDFLIAIQSPAARAEMQHKALVKAIYNIVLDIQKSIANIEDQLQDLNDKLDQYATASAYNTAIISLRENFSQYQAAWTNYEAVVKAGQTLEDLEKEYPEEGRTQEQQTLVDNAIAAVNNAIATFINGIEEGSNFAFLTDIQSIPGYLWNPSNPTATYLGAFEAYLRERYPFEHQIVDQYAQAIATSIDMQHQMLVLYTEYYSYKKAKAEEAGDYDTYKMYTENYFSNVEYCVTKNINEMVESIGIGSFLVADELTSEEIAAAKEINPNFTKPSTIEYKVKINGSSYDAYRVRDNASLKNFVIVKRSFNGKDMVSKINTLRTNTSGYTYIYRSDFMINGQYTDDGRYRMVSDMSELTFIDSDWTDLRAALRESYGGGLTGISTNINKVLMYHYEWDEIGTLDKYSTWIMNFRNSDLSKESTEAVEAKSVYDDSGSYQAMVIYKDISGDTKYTNNVLKLNDVGNLSGRTFHVSDGQTLDISSVGKSASNVTIFVIGSGTIKSNANIMLNNSNIIICDTDSSDVIEFNNLNVNAAKYSEAALKIKTSCTVNIKGSCSFNGTACDGSGDSNRDVYQNITKSRLPFACHGIETNGDVTLTGGGSLKAIGATGGAGICFNSGNLTIDGITVEAKGTSYYKKYNVKSAAIGASVCYHYATGREVVAVFWTKDYQYVPNDTFSRGDSTKNGSGKLVIKNSTVSATLESYYEDDFSSVEEIGGIHLVVGDKGSESNHYYCFKNGEIKNSTINTLEARVSSRVTTQDDSNAYVPEEYTITAFTKGSNGVTNKGVSFKLHGDKGDSDWIEADDIGNDKGETKQVVYGSGVGKITSVEFKTNSDNQWWPGKITINASLSGHSVTLYGGRWIGESGTTLTPNDNVYEVVINTGTESGSGTDSNLYLYLKDKNGKATSNVYLNELSDSSNAFESGDKETNWFYAPSDFGECTQVYFYSDHKWAGADWLLQSFSVKKVLGNGSDSGFTFTANQWLTEDKTVCFGKYSGYTGEYYLEVKTANKKGAGTDSDIWLTIHGDKGNTGEIELDKYAGDGNNFEKNDKDCFNAACSNANIGNINKIVIRKNNSGAGPDWHVEYITITEKVADGQKAQCIKFTLNAKIENKTYTFDSKYITSNTRKSVQTLNREIIEALEKHEDGSYSLDVDSNIVMSEDAFALIAETNVIFTLNMKDEDGSLLYSVTFDGSQFESNKALEFRCGYSASDGNAVIDFLANAQLPAGTVLKINAAQLGFANGDSVCVLQKGDRGWSDEIEIENKDGLLTLTVEEGKQLLLKKHDASIPTGYEVDGETNNTWIWIILALVVVVAAFVVVVKVKNGKHSEEK